MDNEKLQRILQKLSLSTDEKEKMRDTVSEYMKMNPVRQPERPIPISLPFRFTRTRFAFAAILLFFMISGGVAAEKAVPGDPLYLLKTEVNESILRGLAFSPEAEARVETFLIKRRLEEVETLAARGELDTEIQQEIQQRIAMHVRSTKEDLENTSQQEDISAELEAVLAVHEKVLDRVSQHSTTTRQQVQDVVRQARGALPSSPATTTTIAIQYTEETDAAREAANDEHDAKQKQAVEKRIDSAKDMLQQFAPRLSSNERNLLEDELERIRTRFENGSSTEAIQGDINKIRELISVAARLDASSVIESVFDPEEEENNVESEAKIKIRTEGNASTSTGAYVDTESEVNGSIEVEVGH